METYRTAEGSQAPRRDLPVPLPPRSAHPALAFDQSDRSPLFVRLSPRIHFHTRFFCETGLKLLLRGKEWLTFDGWLTEPQSRGLEVRLSQGQGAGLGPGRGVGPPHRHPEAPHPGLTLSPAGGAALLQMAVAWQDASRGAAGDTGSRVTAQSSAGHVSPPYSTRSRWLLEMGGG